MNQKSVDYDSWDFSGKGKNIIYLLTSKEKAIWDAALPYQDKRNDRCHAEFVTYFTLKLTELLKGKGDITIPAAILHDIGWSQLPKSELKKFYDSIGTEQELKLRKRHQEEGIKLAKKILTKCQYPRGLIKEILEIVSQHDTRKGFYSNEDGIVRDSDKLWRFTYPAMRIVMREKDYTFNQIKDLMSKEMNRKNFFYSYITKNIALLELKRSNRILADTKNCLWA